MGKNIYFTILVLGIALGSEAKSIFESKAVAGRWDEEVWKDIPGVNYAKFFVFNVTNANAYNVSTIAPIPILKEVGPYVYLVKREKYNVSEVYQDGSFYFRERKIYEFQPQLSAGSEDDIVNVINTALIVYATRGVRIGYFFEANTFRYLMEDEGEELILKNQRIGDVLLNGRNASVYVKYEGKLGDDAPPGFENFADGRYGLLKGVNGSNNGLLRIHPRAAGTNVGQIISWNDLSTNNFWNGTPCNQFSGSDGSLFAPGTLQDGLDVFLPELYRSVPLTKKESMDLGGVKGNRYKIADHFLEDIDMYPGNQCYCTDYYSRCLRRGGLDMQTTKLGAPYVVSYPHFMKSDGVYSSRVEGLVPAPSIHETYYDIEPTTGTVLESKKRFQWNIRVGPIYSDNMNLTFFRKIPEFLFPVFWVEESFRLDGDIIAALKEELEEGESEEETTNVDEISPSTTTKTTTTTTPEKDEKANLRWISEKFDSFNIRLIFLVVLIGISLVLTTGALLLLLRNARMTNSLLRVVHANNELPPNLNVPAYKISGVVDEKEKE